MTETVQLFAKTLELARIFGISKSTMMRLRKVEGFPAPARIPFFRLKERGNPRNA